ncbi:tRNA (adenine(22)-N(1))-methyltransferase [Oceanirhabdus sp. W0125-5]|uniref:tRNA (adenine(22)-N(1))-methyltransferase n=1 Tax=Oceanirhabdus sp. W0125-5 TaxID=2999116 RepID=UPI0022F33DB5|nr:class I SAM-dependent methyltransferase [Oceanirhabdus sp. W0125-5]WBW95759.1 class I SAM-dependent methyltransferase [Oceanirhabdus sp. W0125-5]
MEISIRLDEIINMIDKCERLADIGTDHGYLAIKAIKINKVNRAIASDINKGPLMKARTNIERYNMNEKIVCRLGSGLETLKVGEADCIVIAGMGGNLIRDILLKSRKIAETTPQMILQPTQNPEVLRKFLVENGYKILQENLCIDNNIFYEIIKVIYDGVERKNDEISYEISDKLIELGNNTVEAYIKHKISENKKVMSYINIDSENGRRKKEYLLNKNRLLEEKLNELLN